MENKRKLEYLTLSIVICSFSVIFFLIILAINYKETETLLISKSISDSGFLFFFVGILTFPGFILHYRYEKLNKNRKITFKQNHLEITMADNIANIMYSDILEIENHSIYWHNRIPWNDYFYVRLNLKNGEKIYYNCLTETINSDNYLLKIERIKKYKIDNIYPWY